MKVYRNGTAWSAEYVRRGLIVSELTRADAVRKLRFLADAYDNWDKWSEERQTQWLKKWKRREGETWQR